MSESRSKLHSLIHQDPKFGWDPWLNTETNPDTVAKEHLDMIANATIFQGADTIKGDIGLLPNGLDMYGSYIDNFGGYPQLVAARESSGAFLLSITIFGGAAHCGDIQPGAMVPPDIPRWLDQVALIDAGLDPAIPWIYTSASMMGTCNHWIGTRRVIRWSAHYGHGPHICGPSTCGFPQADWTQWDDKGAQGQNIDRSIGTVLPHLVQPPPPARAHGIANFSGHVNFDTGNWDIQGTAGQGITWGTDNVRWSAEIQVDGSNGSWDAQGMDFNAAVPTTGDDAAANPASGVANFSGSVNFDTGIWSIHGTSGGPTWGAKENWSAIVKVDNRFGDWHIIPCEFNAPPMGA